MYHSGRLSIKAVSHIEHRPFYDYEGHEEEALLTEELTGYSDSMARVDDDGWFYDDGDDRPDDGDDV